jgi:cytochrome c-type biogenesis protein CcmE
MISMRTKLAAASVILIGAFAYLAFAGMQKGWVYFVGVEQYLSDTQFQTQRVRLHGKVAADGFDASKALLTAKFNLTGDKRSLAVVYHGALPDMFEVGRDVVVEGKRDAAGVFQADVLMTKCASKYEPGSPHGKDHAKAEHAEKQS